MKKDRKIKNRHYLYVRENRIKKEVKKQTFLIEAMSI